MDRAARQLEDFRKNAHGIARIGIRDQGSGIRESGIRAQRISSPSAECYAYFSAEFGLVDCFASLLGLGVLAGDHLKSASDLVYRLWE